MSFPISVKSHLERSKITSKKHPQTEEDKTTTLQNFLQKLERDKLNLYIVKGSKVLYSSCKMGMIPLLEAASKLSFEELAGSTVVDKIIGKAAALIISYYKAEGVFAKTISEKAVCVLKKNGVRYNAERIVKEIRKRDSLEICPFEKLVLDINDPKEGYEMILHNTRYVP